MKKLTFIAVVLGLVLGLSFSAYADNPCGAGNTLTVADGSGGGAGITFEPSPNVNIGYTLATDGSTFAIDTTNEKTTTSNGLEYGTASDTTGYYQRTKAATTLAVPGSATKAAFSGWSYMGGGAS